MNPGTAGLLVLAGIGGGLSGSIAGLASLVSYPALLAVGLPPISANVTNTIALVFQGVGNLLGSRPELRGQGDLVRRLLFWSVPGGIIGGILLLLTPSGSFEKVVPGLIGAAALAVLIRTGRADPDPSASQSTGCAYPGPESGLSGLASRMPADPAAARDLSFGDVAADGIPHTPEDVSAVAPTVEPPLALLAGTFAVGIYGGYFGAAAGVMQLALLLGLTGLGLARSSAVRSVVLTSANAVAAAYFAFFGPVDWLYCLPLAIGFLIGGRIGPVIIRHAPAGPLRLLIALLGLGLATDLAIGAYF